MKFNQVVDLAFDLWVGQRMRTFCLLGSPGIGKTSVGQALADKMTEFHQSDTSPTTRQGKALCVVKDLTSLPLEDIPGLPYIEGDVVRHKPLAWLYELCQPGAFGVLVLDDLPAAPQAIQVAVRQLALYRSLNGHTLSDGIFILVTGNRREDKSSASTLPAHFRNAVAIYNLEVDYWDWAAWYASATPSRSPLISAFLAAHHARADGSSLLTGLPKDADENGSYPTPRSWADLGLILPIVLKGKSQQVIRETASAWVGQGAATELMAFLSMWEAMPDTDAVLNDPSILNPGLLDRPDKFVSVVVSLAQRAAYLSKGDIPGASLHPASKLLKALGWLTQNNREYSVLGLNAYEANGGKQSDVLTASTQMQRDPHVRDMLSHLRSLLDATN